MKKLFILICLFFGSVCNASECIRFAIDNSNIQLQLKQEDVLQLSPNVDAAGHHIVELNLTSRGQIKVEKFTGENIGKQVIIYLGDLQVYDSIPITEPLKASSKINWTAKDEYISDILMSCK